MDFYEFELGVSSGQIRLPRETSLKNNQETNPFGHGVGVGVLVNSDLGKNRQINPWGSLANQPGLSDAIQAKRDLLSSERWIVPEKCHLRLACGLMCGRL